MTDQLAPPPTPFWRVRAGATPWWMIERHRRRRRLALGFGVVAVAFLAGLSLLALRARANYLAGERAVAVGAYEEAIARFAAAEVAGVAYPGARGALAHATTLAQIHTEYTTALHDKPPVSETSRRLRTAVRLFATGHYDEALASLPAWSAVVPQEVLGARRATGRPALVALVLLATAQREFVQGNWGSALHDAEAALARAPGCTPAATLASRAGRRVDARRPLLRARLYASHGRWRQAVRFAERALAIDPTYPGTAALLAYYQSRVPHRHKAATTKKKTATEQSGSAASGTTTTPSSTPKPKSSPAPPPP